MLIDSHCHLDFPDFAGELDAVVTRARAAGIARIVTISTRVKRHAEVLAIAERFADVYCSVGTHPHHAHEELDIAVDELIGRTRHSKVVAIGEAGLDYHYDSSPRAAQEQGLRNHIAAARATGLPLVIHSREADADMARILEQETGKGAFPAVRTLKEAVAKAEAGEQHRQEAEMASKRVDHLVTELVEMSMRMAEQTAVADRVRAEFDAYRARPWWRRLTRSAA